jgi:hypothetical protein
MHVNRLMKARIECTVYDSFFENEQIHVFRFYSASCGFGKERETWEGVLKGLMYLADVTSSQHRRLFRRDALAGQSFANSDEITLATRTATVQLNRRAKPWVWGRPPKTRRYLHRLLTYRL